MRHLNLVPIAILVACTLGVYWASYTYFSAQVREQAAARLTLYRSTVEAELRHFAHLPFLLSQDPFVAATLQGGDTTALDRRLARFAQSAGLDAIYLMDDAGLTISASNAAAANSFVGQNYAFRPYFQAARDGALGEFYGIGATTGIPGYFYALAVQSRAAAEGVIAIKLDLSALQNSWQASGERIMLTNADGVVLLASDPAWRYRVLDPLTADQRDRIIASRQFGQEPLDPLDWTRDITAQTANVGGKHLLYLRTRDLPNDWSLHFFVPDDQAVTRASLSAGFVLLMGVLGLIALQVRRVRSIGAALQKSEEDQALLRSANARLAVEIEERRAAEQNLQKTQAELERAGRLAALGQLASSVTHELGQPIAAMRNRLAAAEMTSGPSTLNDKMQGLVARMEDITRQLKFFSRKGRDKFEKIDLAAAMTNALDLLEPTIAHTGATVDFQRPTSDVTLWANALRIEQVMTNIVRNALDAMEDAAERRIAIEMGQADDDVWFSVADSGHGLGDQSFDDLREPFATTRESGRGMGLGLTISAGIVSDHGGTITASDRAQGGALFRVTLPRNTGEASP
ncbi:ATP-binding protein [Yoonia sp. R2331]|uniref:sensor histidine kinase n=1 Tax=Yoonia sp. R2331 TaxID=3237238 RepID=UPI0034E461D7